MSNDVMFRELIESIKSLEKPTTKKINQLKLDVAKKYKAKKMPKTAEIIAHTQPEERQQVIRAINPKPVRELSGVTVVALFAKPHGCPHGKCIYCPGGPGSPFGDTPQSYTGNEPAAMRAKRNLYDPYLQIFNRLEHYMVNGHDPDKLELIFMGGTFPSLDKEYRDDFVHYVYKAINDFGNMFIEYRDGKRSIKYKEFFDFFESQGDLNSDERKHRIHTKILFLKGQNITSYKEEITKNETALIRAIGLTIETKPDWAMQKHCKEMLEYGCTRLEIGVQTLDDNCLKKTNRGHDLQATKDSFQISKDMCFKLNAHMMLGLPASTLAIDEESLKDLFRLAPYRPDMLKVYPCLVVKGTPLYKLWERGQFEAIDTEKAAEIIARSYKEFPRYVRVMRVQRDIPTTVITDGVTKSNLREYVDKKRKEWDIESHDIREREIGHRLLKGYTPGQFNLNVEEYEASQGKEFFIDVVDKKDTMIGFIRLRFPSAYGYMDEINEGTALIRELHVYGTTLAVGAIADNHVQHKGWGKKLVQKAEDIAKENGYTKMAIISGVGVREYYRKLGYHLEGPYMVKKL